MGDTEQTKRGRAEQAAAEGDQATADLDQTGSDTDQAGSDADQRAAERDQAASDQDQARADRDYAALENVTVSQQRDYDAARAERMAHSVTRFESQTARPLGHGTGG